METSKTSSTKVAVVSFDISKGFDSISHRRLFEHLRTSTEITLNARRWLHSFVTGRRQRVKARSVFSIPSIVKGGVPQGSVLGPILYNLATSGLKMFLYPKVLS
jgi:retron-type reverse transcriptase